MYAGIYVYIYMCVCVCVCVCVCIYSIGYSTNVLLFFFQISEQTETYMSFIQLSITNYYHCGTVRALARPLIGENDTI